MDWESLKTVLSILQPGTLGRMVIDIEEAQEDWDHYPEEAPTEAVRLKLNQALGLIMKLGAEWGDTAGFDFAELIEQVRSEQFEGDWLGARNQQDRENWYGDYQ